MMSLAATTVFCLWCVSAAIENPPPAGSYSVSSGSYDLGGFACGKKEPTCNIYYPTQLEKGPFPIATFGHGVGGYILDDLVKSVASLGMIVVAPATSGGSCGEHWKDMLHALLGSKEKTSLHQALGHADWNRTAIFGHSMGGGATLSAAAEALKEPEKYNVKAVIASHGGSAAAAAQITVPAMFTTESNSVAKTRGAFEAAKGLPKVLAAVDGAQHMEPMNPGRLNPFDAHFLGCHVAGLEDSCSKVYGDAADSMCQANKMTVCEIVKKNSTIMV